MHVSAKKTNVCLCDPCSPSKMLMSRTPCDFASVRTVGHNNSITPHPLKKPTDFRTIDLKVPWLLDDTVTVHVLRFRPMRFSSNTINPKMNPWNLSNQ